MGSVAMTLVRSLQQPILVVKATAKNADIAWGSKCGWLEAVVNCIFFTLSFVSVTGCD
jgi:hypothetical protein